MKLKICLILIFLFFFCSNPIRTYATWNNLNLEEIEMQLKDDFIFQESGVRSVYRVNASKEKAIKDIKKKLKINYDTEVSEENDELNIGTSLEDIEIKFFQDNDEDTLVYITIINYRKEITISNLMKELTKLQGKNVFDIRYFKYIKGKINDIEDRLVKVKGLSQITNMNTLEIYNGYVGTANFNNGERVNIALNSYDTGNYLIIGTPVIFTTY